MSPVLQLSDVTKEYPGTPPVRALEGVTLTVTEGELVAIVGPSGSGKSTLMNVMGTLASPTSGTVRLEGRDIGTESDRTRADIRAGRVGFVFQQFHLLAGLSAIDNVATGLSYRGLRRRVRRAAAAETLMAVGLEARLDHRPDQLSGGERQRVAIARALVGDPAIVLADEPTGNLDSQTSDEIVDLLLELNTRGSTILVITHDREMAARMPRLVQFSDGSVVSDTDTIGCRP